MLFVCCKPGKVHADMANAHGSLQGAAPRQPRQGPQPGTSWLAPSKTTLLTASLSVSSAVAKQLDTSMSSCYVRAKVCKCGVTKLVICPQIAITPSASFRYANTIAWCCSICSLLLALLCAASCAGLPLTLREIAASFASCTAQRPAADMNQIKTAQGLHRATPSTSSRHTLQGLRKDCVIWWWHVASQRMPDQRLMRLSL